jgi:hypothetical protein
MADVVLQRITITRELLDSGDETYSVEYEDPGRDDGLIGWLDGLALFEAAKFDLYERHRADSED